MVYSTLICLFVYRTIRLDQLFTFFTEAVKTYAPMAFMIGLAQAFAKVLVLLNAPQALAEFLSANIRSEVVFLLVLNLLLILIGMVVDAGPAVMILAPLLLKFANSIGIDTIHLGIIMVTNLAIGFVTPPFGMNLFISAPMIQDDAMAVGKKAIPFIAAFLAALLLITYIPQIALFLL